MSLHKHNEALVSGEWVKENLDKLGRDDPSYRLVEVDMESGLYDEGHIPGAVSIDWEDEFAGELGRDIVGKTEFEELVGSKGITNHTTVIIYGDKANWFAAHAYWVFKYYGHEDVKLMDGGRHYWEFNDLPMSSEIPEYRSREYDADKPDEEIRAHKDEVMEAVQDTNPIIDVRNPQEYRGEKPPADIPDTTEKEGHIPTAENVPWGETVNADGTFRSEEELREIYDGIMDTDDKAIAYCRIGERSSHTWFVLNELLGSEAANYDGSWTEWASLEEAEIEKGDTPEKQMVDSD